MDSHANTLVAVGGGLAALTLLLSPPTASAYTFNMLDCDQLLRGSRLVVVARAISQTRDTGEGAINDDLSESPEVWVETTFRVDTVLQGHNPGSTLVLHHLREPTPAPSKTGRVPVFPNGPLLVSFDPSRPADQREVVLFLVREPSGRYAPYPDQQLAGIESVYPLEAPSEALNARVACALNPMRQR